MPLVSLTVALAKYCEGNGGGEITTVNTFLNLFEEADMQD